jgi:hypothetical protein
MQNKKKIEATREAAGLSVEELMGQRIELVPDRIEMRHGRRMRHHRHNGGFNNPTDVNITL